MCQGFYNAFFFACCRERGKDAKITGIGRGARNRPPLAERPAGKILVEIRMEFNYILGKSLRYLSDSERVLSFRLCGVF
jgi:hypothetical protein